MTDADTDFVPDGKADGKEHRSAEPTSRDRRLRTRVFSPVLMAVMALSAMFLVRVALESGIVDVMTYGDILWVSLLVYLYALWHGAQVNSLWRKVSREVGDGLMEALSYVAGGFWLGSFLAVMTLLVRLLDAIGVI